MHMEHTGVGNATDIIKGMVSPHHQLANRLIAALHHDYAFEGFGQHVFNCERSIEVEQCLKRQ